ncbi:MAG: hypothetical protein ACRYHA_01810 [Janthinobacterium lividum]
MKTIAVGLTMLALAGCATKHYGRLGDLTAPERTQMSCHDASLEIGKVNGFIQRVEKESEFDLRSVGSFFADFGLGNTLEKSAALKSARERKQALEELMLTKHCDAQASSGM